jgi:hypothetical protein
MKEQLSPAEEILPVVTNKAELIKDDEPDKVKSDLRKFNRAEAEVKKALTPLKLILKISDKVGVEAAMEHLKNANAVQKLVESKRTLLVGPYNAEVKRINNYAKELIAEVPGEITRVKDLILAFQKEEQQKAVQARTDIRIKQLTEIGFVKNQNHYSAEILPGFVITESEITNSEDPQWIAILTTMNGLLEQEKNKKIAELNAKANGADFFGESSDEIEKEVEQVKNTSVPVVNHVPSFGSEKLKGTTKTWTFEIDNLDLVPREYLLVDEVKIREAVREGVRTIPGVKIYQKEGISLR